MSLILLLERLRLERFCRCGRDSTRATGRSAIRLNDRSRLHKEVLRAERSKCNVLMKLCDRSNNLSLGIEVIAAGTA